MHYKGGILLSHSVQLTSKHVWQVSRNAPKPQWVEEAFEKILWFGWTTG